MTESSAVISADGLYRYRLERGDGTAVAFLMLNPSTADATHDDPTIRKCLGFAKRWGFERIIVVNLFAFRATDPRDLAAAHRRGVNVVGPDNVYHVEQAMRDSGLVVAAWGRHAEAKWAVGEANRWSGRLMQCLGNTKGGSPRHPLLVPYDTELKTFVSTVYHRRSE